MGNKDPDRSEYQRMAHNIGWKGTDEELYKLILKMKEKRINPARIRSKEALIAKLKNDTNKKTKLTNEQSVRHTRGERPNAQSTRTSKHKQITRHMSTPEIIHETKFQQNNKSCGCVIQ